MKFASFCFSNFKGIKELKLNLNEIPDSNIFLLVGLNESGKSTILEAISSYKPEYTPLNNPIYKLPPTYEQWIPLGKRANFNDKIVLKIELKVDLEDNKKINEFAKQETPYKKIQNLDCINYTYEYCFNNSKFETVQSTITPINAIPKIGNGNREVSVYDDNKEAWNKLRLFINELIPDVLYFPNAFFEFPHRIYLEPPLPPRIYLEPPFNETMDLSAISPKISYFITKKANEYEFYLELIQDILTSLRNDTTIQSHLIDRIKSDDKNEKNNLKRMLNLMENKITEVVLQSWNDIFRWRENNSKVTIEAGVDKDKRSYLEFSIQSPDGVYNVKDRSSGFQWFFSFMLVTHFRPYRKVSSKGLLYLFDEPASNLHPTAQQKLLKRLKKLCENKSISIIYATHSHYLIDPFILENTFVVINEIIEPDGNNQDSPKSRDITVKRYRRFVSDKAPNLSYVQPVLEMLEYTPSDLELVPNSVFVEGKNDFYTLSYFNQVIFGKPADLKIVPGTGASQLDSLISLYLGWGRNFVLVLDGDKEGQKQKERYIENFGEIVRDSIFTLGDINSEWKGKEMESLFEISEKLRFQKKFFPESENFDKKLFNNAVQESLIKREKFNWSDATKEKFENIFSFLEGKLNK